MIIVRLLTFVLAGILFSCELTGVKSEDTDSLLLDELVAKEAVEDEGSTSSMKAVQDTVIRFDNGVIITWKKRGLGKEVSANQVVEIDYVAALENGTVFDGNHLVKKETIPFFVGWNLQTKGFDFALLQLREGDDVEVFIPAALARGEKGIPGVVPPNANNIVALKVHRLVPPTKNIDDILMWKVADGKKSNPLIGFGDEVSIHYWASSVNKPRFDNSYKRGIPFDLVMGDGNIVPGLYKALHFAKKGDKWMIYIPHKEAYGEEGLAGLVAPNEDIFYDLLVFEVIKKK